MDMQKYVMELLKDYNAMKQEIEALQYELTHINVESMEETIEALTYSASQGEHVDNSGISNKTVNIALTYAQKHEDLETQTIYEISGRLRLLLTTTDRLAFYIDSLEAHQASILREYYFEGYTWRELQDLRGVTDKTLRRHRDAAVKALARKYNDLKRIGLL